MTTPPLLGLRHVALFVANLDEVERFWVDTMGYQVEWRPDPDNVYLTGHQDNLALHRAREAKTSGAERLDHIGLAVPTAEAVDAWAAHLDVRGQALTQAPKTHRDGARSLYFRDPGGTLVQIIHHPPMVDSIAAAPSTREPA